MSYSSPLSDSNIAHVARATKDNIAAPSRPRSEGETSRQCSEGDTGSAKTGATFPSDAATRKKIPVFTGFLQYFPDAVLAAAYVSYVGNNQHNPGLPLHWDRSKSTDEHDTAVRHMMDENVFDTDGTRHLAKALWRIAAALQKQIELDGQGPFKVLPGK